MPKKYRRGFTLVELLVVMMIIGLLTSIATINFTSTKIKGRDARRLADMSAMRTALELYFSSHEGYPSDNVAGSDGLTLGQPGATVLSEGGFSDAAMGDVILQNVPRNPPGGGSDYFYYSLNNDGSDCDFGPCEDFRVEFVQEGIVNGADPGAYVTGPIQTVPAPLELVPRILARAPESTTARFSSKLTPYIDSGAVFLGEIKDVTIDNPAVQTVANEVVAPVSTAVVTVSTLTGLNSAAQTAVVTTTAASGASAFGQLWALFYLLLTQPFMLLAKRKQYAWGIVYDSQKKLPVDLAIVRLVNNENGRVVQTRVTDKEGRIFFFAGKGSFRLEVSKPGYVFPSAALAGEREDGKYANLYFGQKFSVSGTGQVVNPSIPLDPAGADVSDKEFLKRFFRGKLRYAVSVIGLILTAATVIISPSYLTGGLMALNLSLFLVFRRLSRPKQPTEWGVVKDERTHRPIGHAIVRLFSSPYNKLVETRVADAHGRYNFLVGQNVFYLTATAKGYWKTESYPLDLRASDKIQVISAPIALRPTVQAAQPSEDKQPDKS